jgi:hypothetical protein
LFFFTFAPPKKTLDPPLIKVTKVALRGLILFPLNLKTLQIYMT